MLRKALLIFIKLGLLIALALWFANLDQAIVITLKDYAIHLRLGVALGVLSLLLLVAIVLSHLVTRMGRAPGKWRNAYHHHQQIKAYESLNQSLLALMQGDEEGMRRPLRSAQKHLPDHLTTHLLTAQQAQLQNDEQTAKKHYQKLLEKPEGQYFALRNLVQNARRKGALTEAWHYIQQAYHQRPHDSWVLKSYYDLALRLELWDNAFEILDRLDDDHLVMRTTLARQKAALRIGAVQKYDHKTAQHSRKHSKIARKKALDAVRYQPHMAMAHICYAQILYSQNQVKLAEQAIRGGCKQAPHRDLANLYVDHTPQPVDMAAGQYALTQVKRLEELAQISENASEILLVLAQKALQVQLWGIARRALDRLCQDHPTRMVYFMLAECERAEHADSLKAAKWLEKTVEAKSDKRWYCSDCHHIFSQWKVMCTRCDAVGSFIWSDAEALKTSQEEGLITRRKADFAVEGPL